MPQTQLVLRAMSGQEEEVAFPYGLLDTPAGSTISAGHRKPQNLRTDSQQYQCHVMIGESRRNSQGWKQASWFPEWSLC